MNIFYLNEDPRTAAEYHCDKHVVKMILETAQLLSTAHRILDGDKWADKVGLYKCTHKNHPSAVWVRVSVDHYVWTYQLFKELCLAYTARYGKTHKSARLLDALYLVPKAIDWDAGFTAPPQCMPDEYKQPNTVQAYRDYYLGEKSHFAKWAYSKIPDWWVDGVSKSPYLSTAT